MMKKLRSVLLTVICAILILTSHVNAFADEIASAQNGLDVIFVVDHSGSMAVNDRERIALGMVKAFVDTVYSENVRIGYVAYNDQIVASTPPVSIRTEQEREALKVLMDTAEYSGNTDIGLGLRYAYELTSQEDGRKRVVVLISDGESDLKGSVTGRTLEDSEMNLNQTVEKCQSDAIPIYTITFGKYDGNKEVLKKISEQTKASNYTVERPETLIDVLYGILNANTAYHIQEITDGIYAQGTQNIRVKLDEAYLSEIDILLISPQNIGTANILYGDQQIAASNLLHYATFKISDILDGVNELTIQTETKKNQELKVYLLSYRNLTPYIEVGASAEKHVPLPFSIYFKDKNGNIVSDEAFYKGFDCTVEMYAEGQAESESKNQETHIKNGIITGEIEFTRSGTYYLKCRLHDVMESSIFQTIRLQVLNTLPGGKITDKKGYTVLTGEKQFVLDEYFIDPDGDPLKYTLEQGAGDLADVILSEGVLTIKALKTGEQDIMLKVSDGEAAFSYSHTIEVTPLWKAYWWVIVIAFLISGIIIWRIFHKPKPELEQIAEKKAGNRFVGKMDAYITSQPDGLEEIPPLTFPMHKIKDSKVCLGDLMKEYQEASDRLGLEQIFLIADEERKIVLYHSSLSTIMIGSSIACRQIQYSISFGDIIYITSPDGAYELEIHYIAIIR